MYDTIECPDWYAGWVTSYGKAFGTSAELTDTMLRIWWPAFEAAGYAEAEFACVLPGLIMAEHTPNWPREHLAAVKRELRAARERRESESRRARAPARSANRCEWCGWTCWVEVPLPTSIVNGEWLAPNPTVNPACTRCDPGERNYQAVCAMADEGKISAGRPMTLDRYEFLHGKAWIEIVARHRQAVRLMMRAESATESIDRIPNIKRLANAFAMPK